VLVHSNNLYYWTFLAVSTSFLLFIYHNRVSLITKSVFFTPKRPDRLWQPLCLLFPGHQELSLEVKRPGNDVRHLLPSTAEVKNEWSYTSATPVCLHGVNTNSFAFS
jgi:hypothetical protein